MCGRATIQRCDFLRAKPLLKWKQHWFVLMVFSPQLIPVLLLRPLFSHQTNTIAPARWLRPQEYPSWPPAKLVETKGSEEEERALPWLV